MQNTTNFSIPLAAGQTITLGTCGVPGGSGFGDTILRLFNASNAEAASNDDAPGCGLLSNLTFTAATAGTFSYVPVALRAKAAMGPWPIS